MLNAIEIIVGTSKPENGKFEIDNVKTMNIIQQNLALYDKKGEMHYDIISAFIKSMRSDPNAAADWLARMIESERIRCSSPGEC